MYFTLSWEPTSFYLTGRGFLWKCFPFSWSLDSIVLDHSPIVLPHPISNISLPSNVPLVLDFSPPSNIHNPYSSASSPSIQVIPTTVRQSSRAHRAPNYLQDYHYKLATTHAILDPSDQGFGKSPTFHSLSNFLSYKKLSPSYRSLVQSVSTHFEPKTFKHAIWYPHRCDVMAAEIKALELNHT